MAKTGPARKPAIERFCRMCKRDRKTDCWLWQGAVGKNGYGMGFSIVGGHGGKGVGAHRASYMIFIGPIPDDLFVLHKCDNRRCVNPKHLFLGTHQDNMNDMRRKGRGLQGEDISWSKLTEKDVIEIRKSYVPYRVTFKMLAEHYGVCMQLISMVVRREIWRHVP